MKSEYSCNIINLMLSIISLADRRSHDHLYNYAMQKNADCMVILHVAKTSATEMHVMRSNNESADSWQTLSIIEKSKQRESRFAALNEQEMAVKLFRQYLLEKKLNQRSSRRTVAKTLTRCCRVFKWKWVATTVRRIKKKKNKQQLCKRTYREGLQRYLRNSAYINFSLSIFFF
jgi:hypothetical protein